MTEMTFDTEDLIDLENERPRRKKKPSSGDRSSSSTRKSKPSRITPKVRSELDPSEVKTLAKSGVKKIKAIMIEMNAALFEREDIIKDMFRALVASENILLLGPPGTGKTMLAEKLAEHVDGSNMFKWLMNRTTDPSDIIGPFSIKGMENDEFYRVLKGKAADSEFVFFDEIFKANEPVLNFMLSMLNEGYVYNNGKQVRVPLRMAIGASNEFPDTDDLEAFYDRFIFRHWVQYIHDGQNRIKMAQSARGAKASLGMKTKLTLEEIDALQLMIKEVKFPAQMEKNYDRLVRTLNSQGIMISDRRYTKGQKAMMANAVLEGRLAVSPDDFESLSNILWNKDMKELEIVRKELEKFANPYEAKLKEYLKKAEEVQKTTLEIEQRTQRAAEAVNANKSLQDILGKMEDEIDIAEKDGIDINQFKKYIDGVTGIMAKITEECLQAGSGPRRKWD